MEETLFKEAELEMSRLRASRDGLYRRDNELEERIVELEELVQSLNEKIGKVVGPYQDRVSALEAEVKVLQRRVLVCEQEEVSTRDAKKEREIDKAVDELYENGPGDIACDKCFEILNQNIKERITGRLCKNCEEVIRKEERQTILEKLEPLFRHLPSPQNPLAPCHDVVGHFGHQDCGNCIVYNCGDNTNPKKAKDK